MTGQIHSGVLSTKNMSVSGSAASIVAEGSVSLPRQRVDAKVLVLPDIHIEGPALALTLANPIAGIGGLSPPSASRFRFLTSSPPNMWLRGRSTICPSQKPIREHRKSLGKSSDLRRQPGILLLSEIMGYLRLFSDRYV